MVYMLYGIILAAGWFSFRYAWWARTQDYHRPRILMYHMIADPVAGARYNGLRVAPALFERQLAWLKDNGWQFMTLSELLDAGDQPPVRTVVLTFDDGFGDNYSNALPIMRRYGAKATLFLVGQRQDNDWSSNKKAHHNSGELAREPKLSDQQVREMLASGLVELGAHSLTHPKLTALAIDQRTQEIIHSKHHLEQQFGVRVDSFAYPFGLYEPQDVELVRQAGYRAAVTTQAGIDAAFWRCPLELRRLKISGKEGMFAFRLRLRTGRRGLNK